MTTKHRLHPDMQVLVDAREPIPENASISAQRQRWTRYAKKLSEPIPASLSVQDEEIPTRHRSVPVRIYRTKGTTKRTSCIIYMHGGGFMLGDLDSSDSIAWGFADQTTSPVVSIDYRLTPEHPWPAAFDDCYGVLKWLVEQGGSIGVDASRIVLIGDSAGGRLAASMALKARDAGLTNIAAQAMIYASAGSIWEAQSRVEFSEGFGLTSKRHEEYFHHLFPNQSFETDPYAWPVRAPDLSGLPPALIHSAEFDPIRDDGRVYACRLIEAGCSVVFREAKGMIHGFMRARFTGAAAKQEYDFICDFIRSHLKA